MSSPQYIRSFASKIASLVFSVAQTLLLKFTIKVVRVSLKRRSLRKQHTLTFYHIVFGVQLGKVYCSSQDKSLLTHAGKHLEHNENLQFS